MRSKDQVGRGKGRLAGVLVYPHDWLRITTGCVLLLSRSACGSRDVVGNFWCRPNSAVGCGSAERLCATARRIVDLQFRSSATRAQLTEHLVRDVS